MQRHLTLGVGDQITSTKNSSCRSRKVLGVKHVDGLLLRDVRRT